MGDRKIFSYPSPLKGRKILLPKIHVSFADSPYISDIMRGFCFSLADSFTKEGYILPLKSNQKVLNAVTFCPISLELNLKALRVWEAIRQCLDFE